MTLFQIPSGSSLLVFILFKTLENEVLTYLPFGSSVVLAMEKWALILCSFMFSF